MTTKKVGNVWYGETFIGRLLGFENILVQSLEDLEDVDMLVFWGGEDINTKLYGERPVYTTSADKLSERDRFESLLFNNARGVIPTLGICRGSQFLCAMNGGKLWQHVNSHGRDHMMVTKDGDLIKTTSTHHQMMRPTKEMELLAHSEHILSVQKFNEKGAWELTEPEAEIVYHPGNNSLMIQGHPEYPATSKDFVALTKEYIHKYLGVK
jgi:putative glutamine amidotransferase